MITVRAYGAAGIACVPIMRKAESVPQNWEYKFLTFFPLMPKITEEILNEWARDGWRVKNYMIYQHPLNGEMYEHVLMERTAKYKKDNPVFPGAMWRRRKPDGTYDDE